MTLTPWQFGLGLIFAVLALMAAMLEKAFGGRHGEV